jgi:glycosyltransferase involved in cell wall biosynthesis
MTNRNPEVSVIIPTKNRRESLMRAITSVNSQTYPVKEIIVIDDGSDDILSDYVKAVHSHVICLRNHSSMGAPYARNRGWRHATAELVSFLDSDDEMEPDCLKNKVMTMTQDNLDLVVGSFAIEKNGISKAFHFHVDKEKNLRDQLLLNSPFDARTSTFLVKRSVLEEISFDEKLKKHQDWDLFINIDYRYKTGFTDLSDVILHISESDRISSSLQHESTKYFIEKNKNKVSADAMFLFELKMLYKSAIRNDKEGIKYYRNLVVHPTSDLKTSYKLLSYSIKFNILNIYFLHFVKRLVNFRR